MQGVYCIWMQMNLKFKYISEIQICLQKNMGVLFNLKLLNIISLMDRVCFHCDCCETEICNYSKLKV